MFKITIIDMDTNKTLVDTESNCIIGAVREKDGTQSIGLTRTGPLEIAETIDAVGDAERHLLADSPIQIAYTALNLFKEKEKRHAE